MWGGTALIIVFTYAALGQSRQNMGTEFAIGSAREAIQ
jgi:hypothetical protein